MSVKVRAARTTGGLRGRFAGVAAERAVSIVSPILLLAVWELAGRLGALDTRFFPAPSAIAGAFPKLLESGALLDHTVTSLGRVAIGFLIGAVPALVLGIVMGLSRLVRAALNPMVGALYPIPKTAILPLLLLIFGTGEGSKYATVAVGVFFLVLLNTVAGVLSIEPVYLDVGRNFGASRVQVFRTIAIPGALPLIFTGLRLGWGTALILIVVAELFAARSGLGYFINNMYQTFQIENMYAGLIVMSLIGYVSFLVLDELQRWLIPWRGARAV
ncbi:MAG TPA: ABC transporter permease [Candidatus Limnocylindria bacterium]|nr:ABC transporter permease [Candidatus Limnocylindria bacterium]